MKHQAQCLCGTVSITAEHDGNLTACHCNKCRTWGGSAVFALNGHNVEIEGKEYVQRYPSSEWAERCFCQKCGTHLFVQAGETFLLSAGIFTENVNFKLSNQICIDRKAPYYALANDTPKLTEDEFFATIGATK